jgi:hypothetical protein
MPSTPPTTIANLLGETDAGHNLNVAVQGGVSSGLSIGPYDYVVNTSGSTTDSYVFKLGGSGGATVATVVITYADSSKAVVTTVVRTPALA